MDSNKTGTWTAQLLPADDPNGMPMWEKQDCATLAAAHAAAADKVADAGDHIDADGQVRDSDGTVVAILHIEDTAA